VALLPFQTVEAIVGSALAAHRAGALVGLTQLRPRVTRWMARRYLQPVVGTAGDALRAETAQAEAAALFLRWAITLLRPDHLPELTGIDRSAWLDRTSWRPMLAVMCHYGFEPVPAFSDRYRRRSDEVPADNLCGLWAVGPSTFYRYVDKGKRLMAEALHAHAVEGELRLGLRRVVLNEVCRRLKLADEMQRAAWHRTQAAHAQACLDWSSAIWHRAQAKDYTSFIDLLRHRKIELAIHSDTDLLVMGLINQSVEARERFDLCLAYAALWCARNLEERELQAYQQALKIASETNDSLMLGLAYSALGKFYESRDTDRALAFFQDSSEFLGKMMLSSNCEILSETCEAYVSALYYLAWLYVLRNDPRSRSILDQAEGYRARGVLSEDTQAALEQTWGEYWRRTGNLQLALEHKHRALNIYERLGDRRQILSTYNNLATIYGDMKQPDRAIEYGERVLAAAALAPVDPYILAGTLINLGAVLFLGNQWDAAINYYCKGLEVSSRANLYVFVSRSHYNLAEAYYHRFRDKQDPQDLALGDKHAEAALRASPEESDTFLRESARGLKSDILGSDQGFALARLVPQEDAAHVEEMSEVRAQRTVLAVPGSPVRHVQANLAIAKAYLAISAKEREAALALIQKHNLGDQFAHEFEDLRSTFTRELTREQQVAAQWQTSAAEILQEERRIAVLEHLFHDGSIQKSVYARLCSVGLATASKHLTMLAERGLLVQSGRGPSTRYSLPQV
jgi:tetratricopeptide (TPR) repeat protein